MSKVALAVVLLVVAAVAVVAVWPPSRAPIQATVTVREALAEERAGFTRADAPRPLSFPEDHGPHPDFRTEWWYYTGNLKTAAGRHVGFQLTFFRVALAPPSEPRASAWATRQLYFAHFAVTDTMNARFHAASRVSRGALGLAGAAAAPFRVWVESWSAEGAGASPRLSARDGDVALDLELSATKPVVLQGDRGLSRKGAEPGNASLYYSFTRMPATGIVRLGAETLAVSGEAWMDREWSTSGLAAGVVGWDWFAVQLNDGREVMVYLLRRRDGTVDPFSAGTLVAADGSVRRLEAGDVQVETLAHWTSAKSGVRYPARWRLSVPAADLRLQLEPWLADQELRVGPRYWEGAVKVAGSTAGGPIAGQGYVELVGYGE
ncbi:MAG TPA: lipocalin-like domain-containing protein [Methylomirabilota bacterium]|jgi:predicted secreted hydrolase|nr:lipocalin-like domain-containing protein [Methylomirabilota bacterium]